MTRFGLKAAVAAAGASALLLTACDDREQRLDAPDPVSLADLSVMDALPYAAPAPVEYRQPAEGYAWAERAYGLQRAVYDTPPDYGFDYGGVEPLAWETEDDWLMYAEPWDEGYRYYYYEPGSAYPYFVRDNDYGYGYGAGGVLVAVFDAGGRYLPPDAVYRVAPMAGRYYARGHDLRAAGNRARRVLVTEQVWAQRAPQLVRTAAPWLQAAREDRGWRAWRKRDQDRELRRFEPEAARRAVRTQHWREKEARRDVATPRPNEGRLREAEVRLPDRRRFDDDRRIQARQATRSQQHGQVERAEARREGRDQRREHELRKVRDDRQVAAARQQAQARQIDHQRRQQVEQGQAKHQRRQQAERQQRQADQGRQQAEQQHRQQAQGQADPQRRQPAEQRRQQAEQQGRQQAQRQPPQRQQQAQARSAEQQGRPASGRERGGPGPGNGRGHDKKD